jgi:hypothetical protein
MKKAIARIKGRQCVEVEVGDDVKLGDPVPVRLNSASEEVKLFPVIAFTGVSDIPVLAPAREEVAKKPSFVWRWFVRLMIIGFLLLGAFAVLSYMK